jgi:hypothetical protein
MAKMFFTETLPVVHRVPHLIGGTRAMWRRAFS